MTTNLLDAVATYLSSNSSTDVGFGVHQLTIGVNLFKARLPAEATDEVVLVQMYEGAAPVFSMGAEPIAIDNPKLQLLVRGNREDYPGTNDLAMTVRHILSTVVGNTTMSGLLVLRIQPLGMPNYIGVDDTDRPKFTINFQVAMAGS